MWRPVRKGKCSNKVYWSPVHFMRKAGPMMQRINGANEGERGERAIAKASGESERSRRRAGVARDV